MMQCTVLQPFEVFRSRALVGLHYFEFDFLTLFEVRAANVFHVEENVFVRVFGIDETVTASVVEEINRTFRHCNFTEGTCTYKCSG